MPKTITSQSVYIFYYHYFDDMTPLSRLNVFRIIFLFTIITVRCPVFDPRKIQCQRKYYGWRGFLL